MRFVVVFLAVLTQASAVKAYDSRPGDALLELRSGRAGSSLEASQFVHEQLRIGLLLSHAWSSRKPPAGFGLSVGYEGHRRGYALLPRARAALSMALLDDGGLGVAAKVDGGFVWYVVRNLGLGLGTGLHLWGSRLAVDAGGSVVLRW